MLNSLLLRSAFLLACFFHEQQVRKASIVPSIPYLSHLLEVAGMVMTAGASEVIVAAALLHDALEDYKGPADAREVIRENLGTDAEAVLSLIAEVTETGSEGAVKAPWSGRKAAYVAHIRQASYGALLISVADKKQSDQDMLRQMRYTGGTWATLNKKVSAEQQMAFRHILLRMYRERLNEVECNDAQRLALHALIEEYADVVERLEKYS